MKVCQDQDCCRNQAHTMELKVCKNCKQAIEPGSFLCTLCTTCSKIKNECGHCRADLVEVDVEDEDGEDTA